MKTKIPIFIVFLIMMIISCENTPTNSVDFTDAELIQLIRDADKVDVDIDGLPNQSITVINNEIEYESIGVKKASGLGYEVELVGKGFRSGHRNEIFFNIQGRKLDPNDWGGKSSGWDRAGWDKDNWVRDDDNKRDWKCFNLVFPVTYNMPDGSTIIVATGDDNGWAEIKEWYQENPDAEVKPAMQFPVQITFGEAAVTIINEEEMREAYHRCDRKDNRWNCFEIVYPVTYIMPDGSLITVTVNDEDGWSEVKNWYEENAASDQRPVIQYPIDISIRSEDGVSTVTINNEEEMRAAKEECREEWSDDLGEDDDEGECFELVLPVTYIMPDGTLITIEDERGWYSLRNWYEENGDTEEEPQLEYPVYILIESEDGASTVTINNEEEMRAVKEDCRE
ncbi:MAG: hypothetical protein CMG74_11490 [Candidatus Marinimicrobia bacterium]|nr:hypothetical protein [Candidatus Neomarinimicrobiota bacterium]|tara:strand:- start:72932 stop:74116 length:1185 start_codon:yes stop_codon:yes gene_type:complete